MASLGPIIALSLVCDLYQETHLHVNVTIARKTGYHVGRWWYWSNNHFR